MNATVVPIEHVSVDVFTVPTDGPESDGTLDWSSTTLVLAEVDAADETGLGWSYASGGAGPVIRDDLAPALDGMDARDVPAAAARMNQAVRNIGRPGIAGCAISAVETALWDLAAKLAGTSVVRLLGRTQDAVAAYGSGGFCNYSTERLAAQLQGWAAEGLRMVKMKVGREPERDVARVRAARDAIGEATELFVDANGAYSRKQALSFAHAYADLAVTWFEEPVSSDDVAGLRLLRDRAPAGLEIAAGEYAWTAFASRELLEGQAVDVLQIDGTRCGGFTGYRTAAALADAACIPVSAHTSPTLHAHVACCTRTRHVEYFHDHARIEQMFFDGALRPVDGRLRPDPERPGLGVELKRHDAKEYLVWSTR